MPDYRGTALAEVIIGKIEDLDIELFNDLSDEHKEYVVGGMVVLLLIMLLYCCNKCCKKTAAPVAALPASALAPAAAQPWLPPPSFQPPPPQSGQTGYGGPQQFGQFPAPQQFGQFSAPQPFAQFPAPQPYDSAPSFKPPPPPSATPAAPPVMKVTVLYEFTPPDGRETQGYIYVPQGDEVEVVQPQPAGASKEWIQVMRGNGTAGYVPANYCGPPHDDSKTMTQHCASW